MAALLLALSVAAPHLAYADDGGAGPATAAEDRSDTGPHVLSARVVAVTFVLLSALLTVLLLLVPSRAVAATRREVEAMMRRQAAVLQEEDRRRIAHELHDGAGQALTAAHLQLEALRAGGTADVTQVDLVLQLVQDAMEEIRRSTEALAPPVLAELGLGPALARHCTVFAAATGLHVHHEIPGVLPAIAAPVEISCYRIVQEALQNVARHAGATEARVRLAVGDDTLRIEVEDDGIGLESAGDEGVALKSIRERARQMHAELTLHRGATSGLRVRVVVSLLPGGGHT